MTADDQTSTNSGTDSQSDSPSDGDVFSRLFGDSQSDAETVDGEKPKKHKGNRYSHKPDAIRKRKAYRAKKEPKPRGRKPGQTPKFSADGTPLRRGKLSIVHHKFVEAYLKNPLNQADAYRAAFPNAAPTTAINGAYRLLKREDVAAEIERRRNISVTKTAMSRAKLEDSLGRIYEFDFARFYYSAAEAKELKVLAGAPKAPHHMDLEARQVIESYEKSIGKYGDKVKLKSTPRLGAAELLSKLRGWVKDDGRPPITANFQFNFGQQRPNAPVMRTVEAVPERLFASMGLRDESQPAQPITEQVAEDGTPVSTMPPGYEPGRAQGVRIKTKGRELAEAFEAQSVKDSAPK